MDREVTREQMAVFLLRAWYGSSYTSPTATPAEINQFSDIGNSFAKDWIVQLVLEGFAGDYGGGKFCPTEYGNKRPDGGVCDKEFSLDVDL